MTPALKRVCDCLQAVEIVPGGMSDEAVWDVGKTARDAPSVGGDHRIEEHQVELRLLLGTSGIELAEQNAPTCTLLHLLDDSFNMTVAPTVGWRRLLSTRPPSTPKALKSR